MAMSILFGVVASGLANNLPSDTAATVNGEKIPEKLVQAFITNNCVALGINLQTEEGKKQLPKVRAAVIDEAIERTLIAQETEKRGIVPSPAEIDAAEKTTITFWGDENRYVEFLKVNGFSREEYRHYVLRSAAAGKALTASLVAGLKVSPDEVRQYYDVHRDEAAMQWQERVTAGHIYFNAMPVFLSAQLKATRQLPDGDQLNQAIADETERKRKLAEEVRVEAVKPGADFAALAKKYSEDPGTREESGSLGTFPMGTHAAELDRTAFETKPGEISPVVRSDSGFHIVKVSDHKPAGRKSLEEAAPSIQQQLLRTKQARCLKDWLAQSRKSAAILIRKLEK